MSEAARGDARYQSRDTPGGKQGIRPPRATSIALAAVFVAAAWLNSWPLLFAAATGLLWRLPARPLAPVAALALPRERVTIRLDLPFLLACWALATWALWQHRLLPLAVCTAALLLALFDVRERARRSGLDEREAAGLASRSVS